MALYSMVFLGSTPIGGPIAGLLSQAVSPRAGLVLSGVATMTAALGARAAFARQRHASPGHARELARPRALRAATRPRREAVEADGRRASDRARAPASERA
jgi:hypothetical protein